MSDIPVLPPLPASVAAGQTPQWQANRRLRHRPCPVCREDCPQSVCRRPDALVVARCAACEMLYLPDVPEPDDVARFYRSYGQHRGLVSTTLSLSRLRRAARHDPYIRLLETSGGLDGRTVVEIGCSFGQFLQLARVKGAAVRGVEIDEEAAAHVASLGIPCSSALGPGVRADVVCAFQVLEHVDCPSPLLTAACEALPDDGRLLLALPNGGEAMRVGAGWIGYRVDLEHLNYFSIGTLSRLLMAHGLWVEHFWEHTQPVVPRSAQAAGGVARWRALARRIGRASTHDGLASPSQGSFVLTVLARKVKQ